MARVKAKQPSNYGTRFKDISAQIANLPVFRENPQDPAGVAVSKGIIGYGAMGGGIGGPIGAVIGGAYGLVSSLFGISARAKAEKRAAQERRRQYMERKRQQEETFVERRKEQLSDIKRGLKSKSRDDSLSSSRPFRANRQYSVTTEGFVISSDGTHWTNAGCYLG